MTGGTLVGLHCEDGRRAVDETGTVPEKMGERSPIDFMIL